MIKLFKKRLKIKKELLEIVLEENNSLKKSVLEYQMKISKMQCNFGKLKRWAMKNNHIEVLNKIEEIENRGDI